MAAIAPRRSIFQRFVETEALSGVVLLIFASAALGFANSPWADVYDHWRQTSVTFGFATHALTLTLQHWINDGLMAVFFLLVGLEIKRELIAGELASAKRAALPIAAAAGGMALPALIYLAFNPLGRTAHGWGIPMATDIAFALGVLALIAPNAPTSVKVFLAALAIADDVGAVIVIAIFYSGAIVWSALSGAAVVVVGLIALNRAGITRLWPYLAAGAVLWFFVHQSGVHATLAGVALALTIPSRTSINAAQFSREACRLLNRFDRTETGDLVVLTSKGQQDAVFGLERASARVTAPILRLEHALHRFSAFVVMPMFAFANAGVRIAGPITDVNIAIGVFAGLVVGKPAGIVGASWLATKFQIASRPEAMSWRMLAAAACLGGIGFTMSLFIAMLAFNDAAAVDAAKISILGASLVAGVLATLILNGRRRRDS